MWEESSRPRLCYERCSHTERSASSPVMVSPAGIITTVAGDGGPATSAHLGLVSGLAMDPSGNLYVSDQFYDAVRMLRVRSAHTRLSPRATLLLPGKPWKSIAPA